MTEEKSKQPGVLYTLNQVWLSVRVPLAAIILALLVGAVILILSGVNPLKAYQALFVGAFGETRFLLRTLDKTTPLIFSGLAVAFGFKAGLFNIGAQGQLLLGAMTSAVIGFSFTGLPPIIHIPLALFGGAFAGALYGFIPGALKTYTGAHEVITTIMLNYIAINITDYLADGPFKDPSPSNIVARTAVIQDSAVIPSPEIDFTIGIFIALILMILLSILIFAVFKKVTLGIKNKLLLFLIRFGLVLGIGIGLAQLVGLIAPEFYAQPASFLPYTSIPFPIGFFIAILVAVIVWFILMRTTLGFEIRTVGLNPHAAKYAGMKVKVLLILAMVISGFLAGMGGSIETQAVVKRYQPGFNTGLGFDGITVALLGRNHPLGVIPAALLIGAMQGGSNVMQYQAGVPSQIIDVIQALMLFFVAADMIVRWVIRAKARPGEVKIELTSGWGKQ